ELHHDEGGALGFTELVDARHVGMSERRKRSGFSLQALDGGRIEQVGMYELHRDVASQPRIAPAIDLAHAAATERFEDFVRTQTTTTRDGHGTLSDLNAPIITSHVVSDCPRRAAAAWYLSTNAEQWVSVGARRDRRRLHRRSVVR